MTKPTQNDLIVFTDEDGVPWAAFVWGEADPTAVADLSTHTKRLADAKARKVELRLELDAVNAAIEAAQSAIDTTQSLVKELASRVGQ